MLTIRDPNGTLDNRLQLSCIPYRVLDHLPASDQDLLLCPHVILLLREVYPPVLDHPASSLCKFHHTPFTLEEEQILRVGYWQRRVCLFRTGCDLVSYCANQNLPQQSACPGILKKPWRCVRIEACRQAFERLTSVKTPYSSLGTPSLLVAPHTRS